MNDVATRHLDFEDAVRLLGDTQSHKKPYVQRVDGVYTIVSDEGRRTITPVTFTKLCTEACITAQGEYFVPTDWCVEFAKEI